MENDIKASFKQNSFSRSLANDAKLGAYYTDVSHCERLGQLFSWPEEEVCILEPSIGDGVAVETVTRNCPNRTIFAVELNKETAEQTKQREEVKYLLNEDFLNGIKVSHKSFSFCFANPPYGVDQGEGKERLEKLFLEKIWAYMKDGGILALVIPYYVLTDPKVLKSYRSRYNPLYVAKFDDDVYKQFKQIVIIGQKRHCLGRLIKEGDDAFEKYISSVENLAYLPKMGAELKKKIPVPASSSETIEYFTTLKFDSAFAGENLGQSPLYGILAKKAMPEPYIAAELSSPPVPLKKDSLYLCSIAGYGQGLAGSAEKKDLHLQRGVAKIQKEMEVVDGKGDNKEVIERTYTKIVLNVIENDGTISTLN